MKGTIAASAIGAIVLIAAILYLLAPNVIGGLLPSATNGNNATPLASTDQAPKILLVVLPADGASTSILPGQQEISMTMQVAFLTS